MRIKVFDECLRNLSLVKMGAPFQDLCGHAHLKIKVLGCIVLKERRHLHAQTSILGRTLVDCSLRSQRLVWLHAVAHASVRVDIGEFAPGGTARDVEDGFVLRLLGGGGVVFSP